MTIEIFEHPDAPLTESPDGRALDRKIQDAGDVRAGTFRYSDPELGEVRTCSTRTGSMYENVQANAFKGDNLPQPVGSANYRIADGAANIDNDSFRAANYGTEGALLQEISERGEAQGADRLRVWVKDDISPNRWTNHGFQPTEGNPGATGLYWERKI